MRNLFAMQLLAMVLASGAAVAQAKLDVPSTLNAGDKITISYSDPGNPNGTVTISIDDGNYPNPIEIEVQVQLDAHGNGEVKWVVPSWDVVNFNAPGVREVSRPVAGSGDCQIDGSPDID